MGGTNYTFRWLVDKGGDDWGDQEVNGEVALGSAMCTYREYKLVVIVAIVMHVINSVRLMAVSHWWCNRDWEDGYLYNNLCDFFNPGVTHEQIS
jgi:hypothetical protein